MIHVASVAHWLGRINSRTWRGRRPYLVVDAYGQSKLGNILFSDVLAQRLAGQDITSNALHPGGVDTPDFPAHPGTADEADPPHPDHPGGEAAQLPVRLALDPAMDGVTGGYFDAKGPAARSPRARNKKVAERLYQDSMALLGINPL